MNDDAQRQSELYNGVWNADCGYGTAQTDVIATIGDRIWPHMARVLPGFPTGACRVIDFGAGDGRFLDLLPDVGFGVDVYKPPKTRHVWFQQAMWEPIFQTFDYAISTDALEHLPERYVPSTLQNIARCAPHGFLRISLVEDRYGTERGLHLHETVWCSDKWLWHLEQVGINVQSYRIYFGDKQEERALEVWF